MKIDLNLLPLFLAVAQEHNFRAAADRLGVTRSAVSQGIRRLEDAFGIALVMRTTRSVRLTEAGGRLHDALSQPFSDIETAFENVASDNVPRGLLRIAATSIAEQFLSGPLIASFAATNPFVTIDVTVTDDEFDIVAAGYDAGVRLGEVIEQDMVAIPITDNQREMSLRAQPILPYTERRYIHANLFIIAASAGAPRPMSLRIDGNLKITAFHSTSPSNLRSQLTISA